jgi:hypothetical protein
VNIPRIRRSRLLAVAFVAAFLARTPAMAQDDGCLRRAIPVDVLTERGEMVTGLTPQDFKACFHRTPVQFLSVTPNQSPQHFVIAIDASGSMTFDRSAWQYSLDVARDFAAGLPPSSEVGLAVFSTHVLKLIPLSTDRAKLNDELALLQAEKEPAPKNERETALWGSLSSLFDSIPLQEDDLLFVFTDGEENYSKTHLGRFTRTLCTRQIRFFAFSAEAQLTGGAPQTGIAALTPNALQNLQDLADSTGGYVLHVSRDGVGSLPVRVDKSGRPTPQGQLVLSQFQQACWFNRVQVELAEPIKKPHAWNLQTHGLTARNVAVVSPRSLTGCAAPWHTRTRLPRHHI